MPPRPEKIKDLLLGDAVHAAMAKNGITSLMPIQAATIQHLRAGTDVIARAKVRVVVSPALLLATLMAASLCLPADGFGQDTGLLASDCGESHALGAQAPRQACRGGA
jgi:hypothetical protein